MDLNNVSVLENKVLVQVEENEKVTEGGWVIPTGNDSVLRGVAVKIGPGKTYANVGTIKPEINTGDTVIATKDSGIIVTINEIKYRVITTDDILAIVSPTTEA